MQNVLILGAGKIGRVIAGMLAETGDFAVTVADRDAEVLKWLNTTRPVESLVVDASDGGALQRAVAGRDAVVSALGFRENTVVARACIEAGASYFDLTEDVATTEAVKEIAQSARPGQILMPQCGLAPGFINILAYGLAQEFSQIDTLELRVGALPRYPTNALKYNLTWSTEGLVNEYCNLCQVIRRGVPMMVEPMEGLEHFSLDGDTYEVFNTSGGVGTLCETLNGRVQDLNYKTIRYPGHRDLMMFLVNDLALGKRPEWLESLLERSVPATSQDVVVIFCSATGERKGSFERLSAAYKVYPRPFGGAMLTAIQSTTAAGMCATLDLHRTGMLPSSGFVRQEDVPLDAYLANRFGAIYGAFEPQEQQGSVQSTLSHA